MARFKADEAKNYGGQGGSGFFSLSADKEVKQVRFMYNSADDIEGLSVHKVTIDGKDRYVNCLRAYNDPVDMCPLCREHVPVQARLFIPVYNIDEDAVQIWVRGKTMFQKMASLCTRYATKRNLVNNIFDVERNGAPKDKKTTYEIYSVDADDVELEDLPEVPEIVGKVVLDKTADDMEYYLEEGEFPPEDDADDAEDEAPVRRRNEPSTSRDRDNGRTARDSGSRAATRRTPANASGRRNSDAF